VAGALRVDVVNRRVASAVLLQDFHRMHSDIELDVVTLDVDVEAAIAAVEAGTIDATFHGVPPQQHLPEAINTARVIDESHELLVGPRHPLANARAVTPAQLAGYRIWMPGLAARGEVADYYAELTITFGLTIDMLGPVFGNEALLDEIADSSDLATLVGERSRYLWPDNYDLRRLAIRDPTPVYPMSLIWRDDNPHPVLNKFRAYLDSRRADTPDTNVWTPKWGRRSAPRSPAR
jgi:DNA-binding transcriptional LysR family regulator